MVSSSKIQEKIIELLVDQENHSVQEMKSHLSESGVNDYTEGQLAGSLNTLQRNGMIRKIDRGVYALGKRREDMRKCFVVSPIGEDGSDIRLNADKLFKYIIKPVCELCEFDPIRVDQLNDANSITQTIIEHLENADLVIADITGHNPNVFYEMGYRARTKKPMVHLKKKGENLPFDVNTIRTFEYDLTDLDSVEEIKERLQKTIESFAYPDSDNALEDEAAPENTIASIMPVLYQILDATEEIKNDVKNISTDTIATVIRSMQPAQPQMSGETALQMQLVNGFMKDPEGFMKLIEYTEKMAAKTKK